MKLSKIARTEEVADDIFKEALALHFEEEKSAEFYLYSALAFLVHTPDCYSVRVNRRKKHVSFKRKKNKGRMYLSASGIKLLVNQKIVQISTKNWIDKFNDNLPY